MIHIQKISWKWRRVIEISEVVCIKDLKMQLKPLYSYNSKNDCLIKTSNNMLHRDKLLWN
jgi:hypothetical protein